MIRSDEELKRWWSGLTKSDQAEIVERIDDLARNRGFADAVVDQFREGEEFTGEQLAKIRMWAP